MPYLTSLKKEERLKLGISICKYEKKCYTWMWSKVLFLVLFCFQINHIRNKNRIHCFGQDPPNPCTSFEQLAATYGLNPQIIKNVASIGYTQPTPIQIQAIPAMMDVSIFK